jgi:hypothetical protein
MPNPNYEDLVKQAEQAVAPVKDPELKRIAFEKILDSLLGTPGIDREVSSKPKKGRKTRSSGTRSGDGQEVRKKDFRSVDIAKWEACWLPQR